ncbi:ATP-binding SpoIIE family protein phosphatase [Streptomyces sp. 3214.6]|uniref:ATP-binding SpoIIE family protein phosphatase n=1 Tax=Streptomyces sp. 3214.6 TaxID=1882757 RepID=UPI00090B92B3|nr:SpoIIE family protein phosphatase [Streptomyces sp. 3214.6]SHH30559.1 PAS domain S-box-containing protein [Streptomyces sp. 3214.6]
MDKDAVSPGPASAGLPFGQVALIDARGVVTACSTEACELLGYDADEVVGGAAARLLAQPLASAARRCCAEQKAWSSVIALQHHNGRRLQVRLEAYPLPGTQGKGHWFLTASAPAQTAKAGTGETDQPEATVIKLWALEQLPLPMAFYNHQRLCIAMNTAMTRALGKPEQELLGLPIGYSGPGQRIEGLEVLDEAAEQVWRSGEEVRRTARFHPADKDRAFTLLFALYPIKDHAGRVCAMSVAVVDKTEQFRARQRMSVLNEAGLRIGTTLDLARTADELAEVGTDHFADFVTVDLLDSVLTDEGPEPIPASRRLVFRRAAQRSVLPGCPEAVVPIGGVHSYPEGSPPARVLAEGRALPHHIDDVAAQWWAASDLERASSIRTYGIHSVVAAPLRARGVTLGLAVFCRHRTPEPFDQEDLRLAEELADRAAVYVDNARRYTRERRIALALQGHLLPHGGPCPAAVEVASRYLPADPDSGIGGDWFDVIPLSGARVALVVGDVVGRGIQASATMGRLSTAVRTLADVDLSPDELLTQLDDLVLRMDREETPEGTAQTADETGGEVGATCLYAVYDPISRRCSMARAGHPVPALATPDGAVKFLDIPAGPPLGLGGLPFEVAEFDVPEGSVLAFYTDGLVEGIDRDMDTGRTVLRDVLARTDRSLEGMCDRALDSLLPGRRTDDAALLLARTNSLGVEKVATWELVSDPALVGHARELARDRLTDWHLEDAAFIAELVVSELVTNSIRYGHPPVYLRLIRDTTLICEVSDASSTAPHLRRARMFDEGGRGLLIVAQLAERWGCRHTRTGKTIWAELPTSVR